jgi:hypothetical protein
MHGFGLTRLMPYCRGHRADNRESLSTFAVRSNFVVEVFTNLSNSLPLRSVLDDRFHETARLDSAFGSEKWPKADIT